MNPYWLTLAAAVLGVLLTTGISMLRLLSRTTTNTSQSVAEIKTALVGISGTNGLVSEVKELRAAAHEHGDRILALELGHKK